MVLACSAMIDGPYIVGGPCADAARGTSAATTTHAAKRKCLFMVRGII
jgi:hypothetical protein